MTYSRIYRLPQQCLPQLHAVKHPERLLQSLKEESVKLHLRKYFFGLEKVENLCYNVTGGKISVSTQEFNVVKNCQSLRRSGVIIALCIFATSTLSPSIILAACRYH
jgi:hypothetical protein